MQQRLKKADFTFDDYLLSMEQMKKMGGLGNILGMLPGLGGGKMPDIDEGEAEKIWHAQQPSSIP